MAETTQQLLERATREAQKAAALIGGTYTPKGGFVGSTITSALLTPQVDRSKQIQSPAPTPAFSATGLDSEQPAPVLSPQETEISKRLKELQAGITEASGRSAFQIEQEALGGVPELQKLQRDLSSQLRLSQLEAANIQATPQRADIPTAIGARQKAEELRLNSVKSLQLYAQLEIAKGNLSTAQDAADRATNLKFGPLEEANKAKLANLELMLKDPALTAAEKARAEASTLRIKQADEKIAQAKQDANDIWNDVYVPYIQNGGTDTNILNQITRLRESTLTNPNAKFEAAQLAQEFLKKQAVAKNLPTFQGIDGRQYEIQNINGVSTAVPIAGQGKGGGGRIEGGGERSATLQRLLGGVGSIADLTPSEKQKIQNEAFEAGLFEETPPDWFKESVEQETQSSVTSELLKQLWNEYRAPLKATSITSTSKGGGIENPFK